MDKCQGDKESEEAIQKIASSETDDKARKKKLKELEAEAWEDFLDMTTCRLPHRQVRNLQLEQGCRKLLKI